MQKTAESTTIRISRKTHETLKELSRRQSQSMHAVLNEALEKYRRTIMINQLNEDYAALRKDRKAWGEELKERRLWDVALPDGLEND